MTVLARLSWKFDHVPDLVLFVICCARKATDRIRAEEEDATRPVAM
jgi:hypothetical protein